MSGNSYKRTYLVWWITAMAYSMAIIALAAGMAGVIGIEKHDPYQKIAVLMLAGWGALTILVVRIVDYAGRSAHASEEAAKSARASEDLLRQLLRSQSHGPEA